MNRYGYIVDGKTLPRVSTIIKPLDDPYNLHRNDLRRAVWGAVQGDDLVALARSVPVDDRSTLERVVDSAHERSRSSAAANLGTAKHAELAAIDEGRRSATDADELAYVEAIAAAGLEPLYVEQVVLNEEAPEPYAGTADRFYGEKATGRVLVGDIKTGQDPKWFHRSTTAQVAAYVRGTALWDPGGRARIAMPEGLDLTTGLLVHCPVGQARCELYSLDLVAGWRAFRLALEVRQWRRHKGPVPYEVVVPLDVRAERRAWLVRRVLWLVADYPDVASAVAQSWPLDVATFRQSDAHSLDELDAITAVLDRCEAQARVPFGELDPTQSNGKERSNI
jgi:hypothetical protein